MAQQVGGREAELPAALVAADDDALEPVRPAERGRGRRDVAGVDAGRGCTSRRRPCRRRRPAAAPSTPKPKVRPSRVSSVDVAGGPVAEPEVVADHHERGVQVLDQDVVHELLGRELGELRRERDHAEHVDAERLDQLGLAGRLGQHGRVRAGPDHLGRVRVEGHDHRRDAEFSGPVDGVPDDLLVPPVDAVEDADGDHRPAPAARRRLIPPPPLHSVSLPATRSRSFPRWR